MPLILPDRGLISQDTRGDITKNQEKSDYAAGVKDQRITTALLFSVL